MPLIGFTSKIGKSPSPSKFIREKTIGADKKNKDKDKTEFIIKRKI